MAAKWIDFSREWYMGRINAGDTEITKDYIKETLSNKELNDAQKSVRLLAVYGAMYDKNYDDFRNVEIASIEERLHNKHNNKNTNGIMTVATDKKSGNITDAMNRTVISGTARPNSINTILS